MTVPALTFFASTSDAIPIATTDIDDRIVFGEYDFRRNSLADSMRRFPLRR